MEFSSSARFEVWCEEDFEALPDALAHIPKAVRTFLLLRYQQEVSCEQIAGILELPLGTVQSRLHQTEDFLRTALSAEGPSLKGGMA